MGQKCSSGGSSEEHGEDLCLLREESRKERRSEEGALGLRGAGRFVVGRA